LAKLGHYAISKKRNFSEGAQANVWAF